MRGSRYPVRPNNGILTSQLKYYFAIFYFTFWIVCYNQETVNRLRYVWRETSLFHFLQSHWTRLNLIHPRYGCNKKQFQIMSASCRLSSFSIQNEATDGISIPENGRGVPVTEPLGDRRFRNFIDFLESQSPYLTNLSVDILMTKVQANW